jgi:hypothetical protein
MVAASMPRAPVREGSSIRDHACDAGPQLVAADTHRSRQTRQDLQAFAKAGHHVWCQRRSRHRANLGSSTGLAPLDGPERLWATGTELAGFRLYEARGHHQGDIRALRPRPRAPIVYGVATRLRPPSLVHMTWPLRPAAAMTFFRAPKNVPSRPAMSPPVLRSALGAVSPPSRRLSHESQQTGVVHCRHAHPCHRRVVVHPSNCT